MRGTTIHPTAIVEDGAYIGEGSVLHAYAIIKSRSTLGPGVVVHPFAVIGDDPQDQRFDTATESGVRIGAHTVIREHVTVHRATQPGAFTGVGDSCMLMAGSHVAHDCAVGNGVVLANNALLGGHVRVGDCAFLGGGAVIHQFCRIGEGAMIGGGARISRDVPAYTMATERDALIGLNLVGIKRRGLGRGAIHELKEAFRLVYGTSGSVRENARLALERVHEPAARRFLECFAEGTRGFVRPRRERPEKADVTE